MHDDQHSPENTLAQDKTVGHLLVYGRDGAVGYGLRHPFGYQPLFVRLRVQRAPVFGYQRLYLFVGVCRGVAVQQNILRPLADIPFGCLRAVLAAQTQGQRIEGGAVQVMTVQLHGCTGLLLLLQHLTTRQKRRAK